MPTKQWMKQEKKNILEHKASLQVRNMYAESFALSEQFTKEFKQFWSLPEDWMIYEKDLNMPKLGKHINRFQTEVK